MICGGIILTLFVIWLACGVTAGVLANRRNREDPE